MTKFSNKFKKLCFWPIFPIFGAKRFFLRNPALSHRKKHGPLTSCWVSQKTNESIPRKLPDGRTERWKDGKTERRTLIHRTLPTTARGATRLELKFQEVHFFKTILTKFWNHRLLIDAFDQKLSHLLSSPVVWTKVFVEVQYIFVDNLSPIKARLFAASFL